MTYLYLLDTNIVSDLVKRPSGKIAQRIAEVGEARICTNILVSAELRFGAEKNGSLRLKQQVNQILEVITVLPLESPIEFYYADIRAYSSHIRVVNKTILGYNFDKILREPHQWKPLNY